MMASAPSNTAIDTSETSARVGTGAVIIDSSIWVATTTGLPARRAARVICFWMPGTASSGISTPRSPRATISASESSMISSSRSTACGFSILDMSRRGRARSCALRSGLRGAARRTARPSRRPVSSTASRSARSFSVSAPTGRSVSGRLTPFLSEILVPATTVADDATCRRRSGLELAACRRRSAGGGRARPTAGFPDAAGRRASLSPGVRIVVEREGLARLQRRPCRRRTCRRGASVPAGRRGCRSAGRRRPRPRGCAPTSVRISVVVGMAHVDAEDVGAGLEQLLGSSPRSEEAGPSVARILTLRLRSHGLVCPVTAASPSVAGSSVS